MDDRNGERNGRRGTDQVAGRDGAAGKAQVDRLVEQLWPTPEPPADLAARVVALAQREAAARQSTQAHPAPTPRLVPPLASLPARPIASPPQDPRAQPLTRAAAPARLHAKRFAPRRVMALSGLAAAAALLLVTWWAGARLGQQATGTDTDTDTDAGAEGQLLAARAQTVNIGTRAAAAAARGADLAWSVRGKSARVAQRRGSVVYRVQKGGPFRVVTPAGDVEVTGTSFRVSLGTGATGPAAHTLVTVLEGSVKVHTGAGTLSLTAGQSARLVQAKLPETVTTLHDDGSDADVDAVVDAIDLDDQPAAVVPERPSAPPAMRGAVTVPGRALASRSAGGDQGAGMRGSAPLLLPLSERVHVYSPGTDALKEVSLTVPPGDPSAQIEVARDAQFKQGLWKGPARAAYVTVPAPERGDLYWRLAGNAGPGPAGHARFLPDSDGPVAGVHSPHNVVSDGRDSTTIYFQNAPPALSLTFTATPGARQYRVRIYRAQQALDPIFDRVVSEARCAVAPSVLSEGNYVWSAMALDAAGRELGGGRVNKLDLVYDNALRTLRISEPGPVVAGRGIEVRGVAPLGARLFVNGKATVVDDKGRFAARLPGGAQVLVFRVLGRDGGESYWVRRVKSRI